MSLLHVSVHVNSYPLLVRSAVSLGKERRDGKTRYRADDGRILWHDRALGALPLAVQLLQSTANEDAVLNS